MTVTVPKHLRPKDLAALLQVSVKKARAEFRKKRTVQVGRSRRMPYAVYYREYVERAA